MAAPPTASPRRRAPAPTDGDGDSPVFVDPSGRRRGPVRILGLVLGGGLVVLTALLVAGLLGASPVPLPGWPGAEPARTGQPPTTPGNPRPTPKPGTARPVVTPPGTRAPRPTVSGAPTPTAVPTTNPGSDNRHVPSPKPSRGRP
ncbi:hypothetical protein [Longispora urticae]